MISSIRNNNNRSTSKGKVQPIQNNRLRSSLRKAIDIAKLPPVYKIRVQELNCQFGIVTNKTSHSVLFKDAIRNQRKQQHGDVTMVFAMRQPGCAACREHGLQLAEFAANDTRLSLMGMVKETGVDDEGLLDFYDRYFNHNPIFKDENWDVYKAMGNRRTGILSLMKGLLGARKRLQEKHIKSSKGNMKSEAWMLGGVMLFDKKGEVLHVEPEVVGRPYDMEAIKRKINEARDSYSAVRDDSTTTGSAVDINDAKAVVLHL